MSQANKKDEQGEVETELARATALAEAQEAAPGSEPGGPGDYEFEPERGELNPEADAYLPDGDGELSAIAEPGGYEAGPVRTGNAVLIDGAWQPDRQAAAQSVIVFAEQAGARLTAGVPWSERLIPAVFIIDR